MPRITEVSKWNRFKYHLVIVQRLARCNYMLQRTSGTAAAEQPSSFNNKLSLPLLKSFFAHDKKSWLDIVWGNQENCVCRNSIILFKNEKKNHDLIMFAVSNTLTSRRRSFVAIYTAIYIYPFNDKLRHIYMVAYRTFRKMKRRKINWLPELIVAVAWA